MIKKFILLGFLTVFTLNVFAQDGLMKKATKITNEMSEVLSLNEEEKTMVFEIQLKRFKEVVSIRKKYKGDSETKKRELKKVHKRSFGKLKSALGKDKMQQWADYKKGNRMKIKEIIKNQNR